MSFSMPEPIGFLLVALTTQAASQSPAFVCGDCASFQDEQVNILDALAAAQTAVGSRSLDSHVLNRWHVDSGGDGDVDVLATAWDRDAEHFENSRAAFRLRRILHAGAPLVREMRA